MSNLYGDIEEFVRCLRRGGRGQLAQSLEDAVLYGATSGEILTNVARLLERTRRERFSLPEELALQRDEILQRTARALGDVGQR
ncbi:hypothetical protein DLJ46_13510 [Micromonospora globispora]|uniref:Uncharacterized protein n=1 Tax=Micromonospora globispora TaxID=1450148 RepID=A0A317K4A9_9ACTN|nr:hypothetical protein [Micromonospora globispora]PWU47815.1 hypothetical protein DLJ46_13510 [Micromonospora globispora]RQW86886.1 hypothetical protein DKL51_26770 [Micromonospora globispora]